MYIVDTFFDVKLAICILYLYNKYKEVDQYGNISIKVFEKYLCFRS